MISAGSVTIEDGVKAKEEYAPARKVSVTLSFIVPEGIVGDDYLNRAADLADAKVNEKLGRCQKEGVKNVAQTPVKAPVKAEVRSDPAPQPGDTLLTVKLAPEPQKDVGAFLAAGPTATQEPGKQPATATGEVKLPSHADLYNVITRVMDQTKKGEPIRAIMVKYTSHLPKDKQNSSFLPPESRAAAMADLEALLVPEGTVPGILIA